MFRRIVIPLTLFASAAGVSQVIVIGGTATTAAQGLPLTLSVPHAPLVSIPDIALLGSGNAVGAPLSSAAANDSRTSYGPSVYNPNGPAFVGFATYSGTTSESISPGTSVGVERSELPASGFEFGIQQFQSGLSKPSNPSQSLAQIAQLYRHRHEKATRVFNNDSIAELNARGVRTGNLWLERHSVTDSSNSPMQTGMLMAINQGLPQRDREEPQTTSRSLAPANTKETQQDHQTKDRSLLLCSKAVRPRLQVPKRISHKWSKAA